jgi:hypothetical protein
VGLAKALVNKAVELKTTEVIELAMNTDGVPLFHSSSYSLWPVLCSLNNLKMCNVFVVVLYGGNSKPSNLDFLRDTIHELKVLLTDVINIQGKQYKCTLKFCVCDAPARAMVKCVKQFSGYFGCDKCSQKGGYIGRITYPECDAPLRDNESFRDQANKEHHNGVSPFCDLPIDIVTFFPVDYMHQVCLGVMRRLLLC